MCIGLKTFQTISFKVRFHSAHIMKFVTPKSLERNIRLKPGIKVFRTIVFIFIVISTTFRPICPPAFFRCLSNSGTFMELRTTSFIEPPPGGVACSDSVSYNRVQVLSIPVYYSPVVRIEPATFR